MAKVEIYTSQWCGYCARAKALLDAKGVAYCEYDVTMDAALRSEMQARAPGALTVPQIFIDDRPIGGSDDLHALDVSGALADLLAA